MSYKKDYYEILGLTKNAAQQEIIDAYQKINIKNLHAKNAEIELAYKILSNLEQKDIYDNDGSIALNNMIQHNGNENPMNDQGKELFGKKQKIKVLLHYFLGYALLYTIISVLVIMMIATGMKWVTIEEFDASPYNLLAMLLTTLFAFWKIVKLAKPMLIADWSVFKTNLKSMIKLSFKTYFIMLGVNFLVSLLISIVNPNPAYNQQLIEQQILSDPLYIIFLTVIFAPIVEEIVFRGCIYNLLTRKMSINASAVVSGLIFGSMHVIVSIISGNFLDLINILTYASMGYFFGRIYYQTNSIWAPITVHFINNSIATVLILLLPFLV